MVRRSTETARRLAPRRPNPRVVAPRAPGQGGLEAAEVLRALTSTHAEFLLVYEANGHNATAAYLATHPGCKSRVAAATEGYKTLRNPQVAAALAELRKDRMRRLGMDADEAALLTAIRARATLRDAFGQDGKLLAPSAWPIEFALAVKSYRPDGTIVLLDQQRATETILQMLGKLKNVVGVNQFDHIRYLAGKQRAKDAEGDD